MFLILPKAWMTFLISLNLRKAVGNSHNDYTSLKEVTILTSGSVRFAIRGKKWQNSLNKAFAIDTL